MWIKGLHEYRFRSATKTFGAVIPILGITWIFGVMAFNDSSIVFQYIFAIINSIQVCTFVDFLYRRRTHILICDRSNSKQYNEMMLQKYLRITAFYHVHL